jgi:prepilin-type N-terminal cleavage/methylation domain-containing protein
MHERIRRARQDQRGFTLIELLIVIVILGILAAIVVFAVNGIQNRGTAAACKADVETVTVAAEAYDAQNGHYADSMDELVKAGLLHSVPSNTNYTIDYKADNGDNPNVSVSSDYCADAATNPTTDVPSSEATSSAADPLVAYCDQLRSTVQQFNGLSLNIASLDNDGFNALMSQFDNLASIGPGAIGDDWTTFASAFRQMDGFLTDAGLRWADLSAVESNQLPGGITQEQSDALNQKLSQPFNNPSFGAALNEIAQHAQSACNMNLSG